MNNQEIIVLIGLPGSGKSTWAMDFIKKNPHYKRVNKDSLREMLHAGIYSDNNEKDVLSIRNYMVKFLLKQGHSVILDDTNFNKDHFKRMTIIADSLNLNIEVHTKFFDTPLEKCIEYDKNRLKPVGEKIIRDMYKRYLVYRKDYDLHYAPKKMYTYDKYKKPSIALGLPKAVIVDVDGTLAIKSNQRGIFEYEKAYLDTVRDSTCTLVNTLYKSGYKIIFLSGRENDINNGIYNITHQWIKDNIFKGQEDFELLLRSPNDYRKDNIIKYEIFDKYIRNNYDVDFAIDDREQVVDMWRNRLGIDCLQVDYGDF